MLFLCPTKCQLLLLFLLWMPSFSPIPSSASNFIFASEPLNDNTFLMDDEVLSVISEQTGMSFMENQPSTPAAVSAPIQDPITPQGKKIERNWIFREPANAGKLASQLAALLYGNNVLQRSSITGDRGRLNVLDQDKLDEIEYCVPIEVKWRILEHCGKHARKRLARNVKT